MSAKEEQQKPEGKLYHEKQVRAMCALHALNNLFQEKNAFSKKDLDQICERLSPGTFINPHRSMLGLGNYDVNVLMTAIQDKGFETIWFDKRRRVNELVPDNIMGFILNIPSDYKVGPLRLGLHGKHWIALRFLRGLYMNLDSKLPRPETIGNQAQLLEFLQDELSDGKKELLLVVEKEKFETNTWRRLDDEIDSHQSGSADRNSNCAVKGRETVDDSLENSDQESLKENGKRNCEADELSKDGRSCEANQNEEAVGH